MLHSTNHPHRRSIRLKGYDYSQEGLYFVTICVQDRVCLFGKVVDVTSPQYGEGKCMVLNDVGNIAKQCLLDIPKHFPNVLLTDYVVMPNHVHFIIEITKKDTNADVGAKNFSPLPMLMLIHRRK